MFSRWIADSGVSRAAERTDRLTESLDDAVLDALSAEERAALLNALRTIGAPGHRDR